MFRKSQNDINPFVVLYIEVRKPDTSDVGKYPTHLTHGSDSAMDWEAKGRYPNIVTQHDEYFPDYNANLIPHHVGGHVLLEGPALHRIEHCERFLAVLTNEKLPITDVIAAGDPLDGRDVGKKGYWHYFSHDDRVATSDAKLYSRLKPRYKIASTKTGAIGGIDSYQLVISAGGAKERQINVHHITNFVDFNTMKFSVEELKRLLAIYHESKNLAIHCSAGMGRTGVIELAYCLFADYARFYPHGTPDFKQIRMKFEELRLMRPALIQGNEQYRMAVIVGMQLELVHRNELIKEEDLMKVESIVDAAAQRAYQAQHYLAPASESDEKSNQGSEASEPSGEESNQVSIDSDRSGAESAPASPVRKRY